MNIFIRVDAHFKIGIGHIYRCLKLASYINNTNTIIFICKKYNNLQNKKKEFMNNIYEKITKKFKIKFIELKNDDSIKMDMSTWFGEHYRLDADKTIKNLNNCDILIVDHYSVDYRWENIVKKYTKKLIILEDFIGRKHNCDLIINGLITDTLLYKNLVNSNCNLFLGNEYLIVGNEFFNQDIKLREKNRISIFISGSDTTNETCKIINSLKINTKNKNYNFDIIVGALNSNYKTILELCKEDNFFIHYNIDNIWEIFNKSYISIGTLGQSSLERIALKIPSIMISLTENQLLVSKNLIDTNCFKYIGNIPQNYNNLYDEIINIEKNYIKYVENCRNYFKSNKLEILFKSI